MVSISTCIVEVEVEFIIVLFIFWVDIFFRVAVFIKRTAAFNNVDINISQQLK